jgi:hypothetical protein
MLRGMAADGLRDALDGYAQAQDELIEAPNRLARAIAGAAMSGMTQAQIVELTGVHRGSGAADLPRCRHQR